MTEAVRFREGQFDHADPLDESADLPARHIVVTGAAGNIGSYFAAHAPKRYNLTLLERPEAEGLDELAEYGNIATADLSDLEKLKDHFQGHDTLVHLAADPAPDATWDSVLPNNIVGTYNAMVAARAAGVRRIIYASSIHAVSGYPGDRQVHENEPVNPGDLYGVSKCFGEAMGRYLAEQEDTSVICIRIGAFQPIEKAREPKGIKMLDAFVSQRDLHQLICRCIDAKTDLRFGIFHGLSDNRFKRMDITAARELLGYTPLDDVTELNPELRAMNLDEVSHHDQQDGKASGIRNEV